MRALFLFSQFATFRKTAHKKSDNLREITTKDTYNRYDSIFGNHFQDFVQKGTRKFRITRVPTMERRDCLFFNYCNTT